MSLSSVDIGAIALLAASAVWIAWRPYSLRRMAVLFTVWWGAALTFVAANNGWLGAWPFIAGALIASPVLGYLMARKHSAPG